MAKPASYRVQSANRAHSNFIRPTAAALAVAACFSGPVLANPTAPTVVNGTASFATAGNILNITNSHNAIINWGSFSIGVNELTKFIQPSALSAVLNRVTGGDPSAILGALQSNGRVFLINPNGILFGAGAQINVAGLVASTLNLSNDDFLNNRMRFTDGAGAGSVVNQGSITGGSVYLVGKAVSNEGLITSPNGEVVLAAGNSVELVNPGTPNLRVEIVAPDNEARNLGTITAEAGRIGIYAGLIKQSGTISADSAVSEGGRIVLKSTKKTLLEAGSLTSARGTSGGEIIALSNMTDGVTEVAGKMDASGTAGNGGFIETSAAKVRIADSAIITAAGGGGGKAGTWLIDPNDFFISSAYGGDISGSTLAAQLAYGGGTNVTIVSVDGVTPGFGNIYVNDDVSWSSSGGDGALTLIAVNNIEVNNAITNSGTGGGVNLYAGWDGGSMVTPTVGSVGAIQLNAPITTGGDIKLIAGGDIVQGAPGSLTASQLLAVSNSGMVSLNNPGAANTVGTIAGRAIGSFAFKNSGDLTIGSVGGVNGITVDNSSVGNGRNATINVELTGGMLTVAQSVYARGGNGDGGEGQAGGNATITLTSSSSMQLNNLITAEGGEGGYGLSGAAGGNGGHATISLTAPGGLTIDTNVQANGGAGGYGSSGAAGGRGGDGKVMMTAGSITVESSRLVGGRGGRGGTGGSSGSAGFGGPGGRGGDGVVELIVASGPISVMGTVEAQGGSGGSGGSGGGAGGRGGDGKVMMNAGSITVASGGSVQGRGARGGSGGSSGAYGGGPGGDGGDGVVTFLTAGNISVMGNVSAQGGRGGSAPGGGNGGFAAVSLTSTGGGILISGAYVSADGGEGRAIGAGGYAELSLNGASITIESSDVSAAGSYVDYSGFANGGSATTTLNSSGAISITNSSVSAQGADGAESSIGGSGGNATVLISAAGGITVSNSSLEAEGGSGGSGSPGTPVTGGAAGLTLLAGGNIQFEGAGGSVYGGYAQVGGNAGMTLVAGGNITLDSTSAGGNTLSAGGGGAASIVVAAAGNVSLVNGASIDSTGTAGLGGVNVALDNSYLYAQSSASVGATGSLTLTNGASIYGGGNAFINTGGNVTVDSSDILGNPDVFMTVGGVVNINNGGTIDASAPSTIHLTFPMLTIGGFFINGIEGVVFDSLTGTGFRADGSPAILGTNLLVAYGGGGSTPALNIPSDALIVALGKSTEPPDAEKDKDLFDDLKKGKEKEAPVCR